MAGWIKLHRDLANHWVSGDPESLAVFVRLLMEANFVDTTQNINGRPTTVKRGDLIFGLPAFSARSGVSISKLRRVMDNLKRDGIIRRQNFSKYSIVSIVNYDQWQSDDSQNAGKRQTGHSQATTPEEGEEGEKVKNNPVREDSGESSPMKCPHGEIIDAWAEVMPDKQQVRKNMWKSSRKEYGYLAARWREMASTPHSQTGEPLYSTREEGVEWWRALFQHIRKSDFLMNDQPWFNFGWVVNKTNFYKIIEGNFHGG